MARGGLFEESPLFQKFLAAMGVEILHQINVAAETAEDKHYESMERLVKC